MKYISIDLETTGLNPETCEIIEFGAVIEDTANLKPINELPVFHVYILPKDGTYRGEPYALSMHTEKFRRIADRIPPYNYISTTKLGYKFREFLEQNGFKSERDCVTITVAGKNFAAFDLPFLKRVENFTKHIDIRSRIIDPAILYCDLVCDEKLPDLETCKIRSGIGGTVAHNSVDDAIDVITLLRNKIIVPSPEVVDNNYKNDGNNENGWLALSKQYKQHKE